MLVLFLFTTSSLAVTLDKMDTKTQPTKKLIWFLSCSLFLYVYFCGLFPFQCGMKVGACCSHVWLFSLTWCCASLLASPFFLFSSPEDADYSSGSHLGERCCLLLFLLSSALSMWPFHVAKTVGFMCPLSLMLPCSFSPSFIDHTL